jgi:hypothetical protein
MLTSNVLKILAAYALMAVFATGFWILWFPVNDMRWWLFAVGLPLASIGWVFLLRKATGTDLLLASAIFYVLSRLLGLIWPDFLPAWVGLGHGG